MTEGAKTIIVPVRDAAKANANFTALDATVTDPDGNPIGLIQG